MADRVDSRPPSVRIAEHYRDLILSGKLAVGSLLPSNKALAAEWKTSPATVTKAMNKLAEQGLVRGIHGVGTAVLGQPVSLSSGTQRHARGQQTGSSWDAGERSDSHTAGLTFAPAEVAAALDIRPGAQVARRSRVYRDSHGVVAHSTSWIPAEFAALVPELIQAKRLEGGTSLDLIARACGREAVQRRDTTSARIATPDDLELLELPSDTVTAAILVLTARFLDGQGRVLEYGVDIGAPGRTRLDVTDSL
ncbi:GntR family transcriptional regulator [Kitasatospora griseola]|uniref:GntR family transcriptional regulator n=1 Tax=Kitasatospora griseola TaxID=2064 RepID=UPI0036D7B27B